MASGRALVVAAGIPESREVLVREAAAHDFVVAVDGGADALLSAGLIPDTLIGDLDSLSATGLTQLQLHDVDFVVHPADKSNTDLELALEWCRTQGFDEITLTGTWGDRQDHSLASVGTLARYADLRPTVLFGATRGWVLDSRYRHLVAEFQEGATVSIIALTPDVRVSTHSMKWPLDDVSLDLLSDLGVSNVVVGAEAAVSISSGIALVLTDIAHNENGRS